jgi:hypothetical protein
LSNDHARVAVFSHRFGYSMDLVRRITTAYLRSALGVDRASWPATRDALAQDADPVGRLQSK